MSISKLPASASQMNSLINQLHTTTFEASYTKAYLSKVPRTLGEKIKQWWAKVWLHGLGRNGWKAGNGIDGISSIKQERECIANYKSKMTDLITHLAKTPLKEIKWARIMGECPENGTSILDPKNERSRASDELEGKISAFYEALKDRVEQLSGIDGANAHSISTQADLFKAGLQKVANRIEQNNKDSGKPYIKKKWSKIVDFEIAKTMRKNLAEQITVDNVSIQGLKAMADTVDLYVKTFESNATIKEFRLMEPKTEIVASVWREILETRSDEFAARKEEYMDGDRCFDLYPEIRTEVEQLRGTRKALLASLSEQDARIQQIQDEIETDRARIEQPMLELQKIDAQINQFIADDAVTSFLFPSSKQIAEDLVQGDQLAAFVKGAAGHPDKWLELISEKTEQAGKEHNEILPKLVKMKNLIESYIALETSSLDNLGLEEEFEKSKGQKESFIKTIEQLRLQNQQHIDAIDIQLKDIQEKVLVENAQKTIESLALFCPQTIEDIDDDAFFNLVYAPQESVSNDADAFDELDDMDSSSPKLSPIESNDPFNETEQSAWNGPDLFADQISEEPLTTAAPVTQQSPQPELLVEPEMLIPVKALDSATKQELAKLDSLVEVEEPDADDIATATAESQEASALDHDTRNEELRKLQIEEERLKKELAQLDAVV